MTKAEGYTHIYKVECEVLMMHELSESTVYLVGDFW